MAAVVPRGDRPRARGRARSAGRRGALVRPRARRAPSRGRRGSVRRNALPGLPRALRRHGGLAPGRGRDGGSRPDAEGARHRGSFSRRVRRPDRAPQGRLGRRGDSRPRVRRGRRLPRGAGRDLVVHDSARRALRPVGLARILGRALSRGVRPRRERTRLDGALRGHGAARRASCAASSSAGRRRSCGAGTRCARRISRSRRRGPRTSCRGAARGTAPGCARPVRSRARDAAKAGTRSSGSTTAEPVDPARLHRVTSPVLADRARLFSMDGRPAARAPDARHPPSKQPLRPGRGSASSRMRPR